MWEARYGNDAAFTYGTEPNTFLKASAAQLPIGDVLCLADGEGRNGVYLAQLGHRVTSMDLAEAGMAKARRLAQEQGVALTTHVGDLATFDLGKARWDLVVSIWAHTPPAVRRRVHGALATALRPGGRLILEAYTPAQIGRGTGGPPDAALTMTLEGLRDELAGLTIEHGQELIRSVQEGSFHSGDSAVVQVIATKA